MLPSPNVIDFVPSLDRAMSAVSSCCMKVTMPTSRYVVSTVVYDKFRRWRDNCTQQLFFLWQRLLVSLGKRERERERETDRQTDRQTDTQTDRHTDRDGETDTDRQTETER